MNLFTVYYLPSMQHVPGAIKIKQANKTDFYSFPEYKTETIPIIEITVDFSNAPAQTMGAVMVSPLLLPPGKETGINKPEDLTISRKEKDFVNKIDGYGLIRNIGALKSITIIARSNEDDEKISIILADEEEQDTLFFIEGFRENQWRSLVYNNPDYIRDVRNLNSREFSPGVSILPHLLFKGLVIYKPEKNKDQKVILLVQSIALNYDKAYLDYDNK
ncbi:MAG: hypothetical protein JXJ04_09515 [Spirochaetales bacterium]|nr:hypothetical protein [Spirochaetales bacterium]